MTRPPSPPAGPTRARQVAFHVLLRVDRDAAFADRVLNSSLARSDLAGADRGLCTELVYGTLRRRRYLDYLLSKHVRSLAKTPPEVVTALRLGAYQLVEMQLPPHSAVSQSVGLVRGKLQRMRGFTNAVLRNLARRLEADDLPDPEKDLKDPLEALATQGAVETWIAKCVADQLGMQGAAQWLRAMTATPALSLRVNPLRKNATDVMGALSAERGEGVIDSLPHAPNMLLVRGAGEVGKLEIFRRGEVTVQDPAAALVGALAAPQPGQVVLDICAAPGGKTTHLAELMQDRGKIVALDLHAARTRLISESARRLGLQCIRTEAADATDPQALASALHKHAGVPRADVVVVDAPCSGLGTLRRNPELRALAEEKIVELAALQRRLLDAALSCLRPGGTLVYSVCTVTPEEGSQQVADLLRRHPQLRLFPPDGDSLRPFLGPLDPTKPAPEAMQPGASPSPTAPTAPRNDGAHGDLVLRTWTHLHPDYDSFFAARLASAT